MNLPGCVEFFVQDSYTDRLVIFSPGKIFFFLILVTCASFNSFGNSALIKQLLNIVFNVSEQLVLLDLRSFWGILFDVVVFLELIRSSSVSIPDKPTLLNEKLGIFFNLLLVRKTLGWFLYLSIAFSTESILLLSVSMM